MEIYKRLLTYLKPYTMRLVWAVVFMALTSGLIALQTYLAKIVVDEGFVNMNKTILLLIPAAYVIVTLFKGVALYAKDYLMGHVGQKVVNNIRDQLYAHTVSLSFSYFTKMPTGIIISRIMNDVNLVQGGLTRAPAVLTQGLLTMMVLLGWVIYLNWRLTLASLVIMPLAGIALSKFSKRLRKASTQMQEHMGSLTTHLHETIGGIRIVKAFSMEVHESRRFAEKNKDLFNALMKAIKTTVVSHPVMEIITVIGSALVMEFGFYYVFRQTMTPGDFVAFMMALLFLYRPMKDLNSVNNIVQDGVAAARRIFEVLDSVPEIREKTDAISLSRDFQSIAFEQVSFQYDGHEEDLVLNDINLTIETGTTVAIVGKSGGGKTTLVNLLPRFYDASSGSIMIGGVDIRDARIDSLRSLMAIVTQQTILFNDTVRTNIAYGRLECSVDEVMRAAEAAYAHDFIQNLPQGYDTIIGEAGVKLSGGQRQRIAIARALLQDAPILILDEATSSLDTESEKEVQNALDRLMTGRTSFVIAHRLSTIIKADIIIVLKDGRIVEQGTHEELLKLKGEYKNLYDQQFRDESRPGGIGMV
ncbi:MAG TPA: lipid A export permease/ATP-binding protein MsbA [Nitrospiraceae bacterium]|nr:lipid A export permease/ATP-binding protein MsbA [Nitrospiraceae bacterium]